MSERFNAANYDKGITPRNLPFITISREYGCPSKEIAALLVLEMNNKRKEKDNIHPWQMINKEIIAEASKELKVNTNRIQKFYTTENRTAIDEILNSLSQKYYHSDKKIQKTLSTIITDFAKKGNVVIVGRGGVCVTSSFKNGIHIRLTAPLEWRAEQIMKAKNCTIEEAKKLANDIDHKRNELLKIMSNNCFNESIFDLTYNCRSFSKEEIAESIIYHLGLKDFA